jgi:hypothetical protein
MNELLLPLAQMGLAATVSDWVIIGIIVAAVIGIGLVILKVFEVTIPPFIQTIAWILLAAIIGVAAIHLLMRMA